MSDNHTDNMGEYTVSELSVQLRRTVEDNFSYVRLRGEISGYRGPHSSGHAYFAIKDEKAKIDAVIWRGVFSSLAFKPEEGMEVIVTGKVTIYPGRSSYQIVVETLNPAGVGALMALLEQRRKAYEAEGVFDEARKKRLPYPPRCIGLVTSPTGAVIRDILHRLKERYPLPILLWPARVQGEGAENEIAEAILGLNRLTTKEVAITPDLIIVARGGGSLEDLWCFNEDVVVRAVEKSHIPIISAIGHETDWTLIDWVADLRAPTPTAAAELATPIKVDLEYLCSEYGQRCYAALSRLVREKGQNVELSARKLPRPTELLSTAAQRLDFADIKLKNGLQQFLSHRQREWQTLSSRFGQKEPSQILALINQRLKSAATSMLRSFATSLISRDEKLSHRSQRLSKRLLQTKLDSRQIELAQLGHRQQVAMRINLDRNEMRFHAAAGLLNSVSYRRVLKRGYALLRDENGVPVSSFGALQLLGRFQVEMWDDKSKAQVGLADAMIVEDESSTTNSKSARSKKSETHNQKAQGIQGKLL